MRRAGIAIRAVTATVISVAVISVVMLAEPVAAQGLSKSLRPPSRPGGDHTTTSAQTVVPAAARTTTSLRPRPRPASASATGPAVPAVSAAAPSVVLALPPLPTAPPPAETAPTPQILAPMTPLTRPLARPEDLVTSVSQSRPQPQPQSQPEKSGGLFGGSKKKKPVPSGGSICGDPVIKGERLARITSKVQGCGIADPVRVTSIDGIRLSQPATLDCVAATALRRWIDTGLRPAYGRTNVVELKIAAHYICRPRNNKKGAKVSEHGRGRAIDIAGIVTSDGRTHMVYNNFDATMRRAYKAGCGTFGTTLGPGSDGYHEDHMHFDVPAQARSPYCR